MMYNPGDNVRVLQPTEGSGLIVGNTYTVHRETWTGHLWLILPNGIRAYTEPSRVELVAPPKEPPKSWLPIQGLS